MHSQYVWNKSALVWHVTTEARKWGDHLPEVPAGHLSGNPRDPNIPLLLILRFIFGFWYVFVFVFLFVGNPRNLNIPLLLTSRFIFGLQYVFVFVFLCVENPRSPNIPILLVRFIYSSLYLNFFWLKVPAGILWTQIFTCSSLFALYSNHSKHQYGLWDCNPRINKLLQIFLCLKSEGWYSRTLSGISAFIREILCNTKA